jgi:hypothetical protein
MQVELGDDAKYLVIGGYVSFHVSVGVVLEL